MYGHAINNSIGNDIENVLGWRLKMHRDGERPCIGMDIQNALGWQGSRSSSGRGSKWQWQVQWKDSEGGKACEGGEDG
eukprot:8183781-Karenia_brevis.AAC.1